MPKSFLAFAALLLLACSNCAQTQKAPHGEADGFGPRGAQRQVQAMLSRTVKVVASNCKGPTGEAEPGHSGSGVILETGVIATARHVVDRDCSYHVIPPGDTKKWAFHPTLHEDADVAVIYAFETGVHGPITFAKPRLGEPIFALGHPMDLLKGRTWLTVTRGVVAAKYDENQFRFTAPIYPGNSGGPIFDRHGRLVGIISAAMFRYGSPIDGMYYGIDTAALDDILPGHRYDGSAKEAGKVRKHK